MCPAEGGSGVTVVYLDRVLLLNLLVDYLLLLTTAQLAGIPCGGEGWLCEPPSGRCTPVRCSCRDLAGWRIPCAGRLWEPPWRWRRGGGSPIRGG